MAFWRNGPRDQFWEYKKHTFTNVNKFNCKHLYRHLYCFIECVGWRLQANIKKLVLLFAELKAIPKLSIFGNQYKLWRHISQYANTCTKSLHITSKINTTYMVCYHGLQFSLYNKLIFLKYKNLYRSGCFTTVSILLFHYSISIFYQNIFFM